ncbi:MAG: hypothetical protein WCY43_02350 [Patescibacteria group bacterium]|jgi:hypothetical protein|nr:hypothetical protein [Patescibacteria group bacterium]
MYNNIYKNQTHLIDMNNVAFFVCPFGSEGGREDGFYKYTKYKFKDIN